MDWDFKREESERESAVTGKFRVVIVDVEEGVTGPSSKKPGTPMITVKLRPSGKRFTISHRIVQNEYFNRNMTRFFDAFPEIAMGDFNFITWIGAEGGALLKADDRGYTQVDRLLSPEQTANLPPFEGDKPERQTITTISEDEVEEDDLPF